MSGVNVAALLSSLTNTLAVDSATLVTIASAATNSTAYHIKNTRKSMRRTP